MYIYSDQCCAVSHFGALSGASVHASPTSSVCLTSIYELIIGMWLLGICECVYSPFVFVLTQFLEAQLISTWK